MRWPQNKVLIIFVCITLQSKNHVVIVYWNLATYVLYFVFVLILSLDCFINCKNGERRPDCTCQCLPGFTGMLCEDDIKECIPNPCQHNGTCTDEVNDYNCSCAIGYTGRNCETYFDVECPEIYNIGKSLNKYTHCIEL